MSHFAGLVILTPNYNGTLEEALEMYDENIEFDEYSLGKVSEFDKLNFIFYYNNLRTEITKKFYDKLISDGIEVEDFQSCIYKNKDKFVEFVISEYPNIFDDFDELYKRKGFDWNNNRWKINPETKELEEYSTYNPHSKWDWYEVGGRWSNSIKTKKNEFVDACFLDEIDWTPFKESDYCKKPIKNIFGEECKKLKKNVKWHFNRKELPFCFVIDEQWIEKGKMGWWAMTQDEMSEEEWEEKMFGSISKLPENSMCYLVDFHI